MMLVQFHKITYIVTKVCLPLLILHGTNGVHFKIWLVTKSFKPDMTDPTFRQHCKTLSVGGNVLDHPVVLAIMMLSSYTLLFS